MTGVLVADRRGIGIIHAPSVILATGGLGQLYGATTNPDGSTGDGIALALWAGVAVSDIEFIQFHPTMLYDGRDGGRRPLVTEAIRGEGAVLVDSQGNSVTAGVHPMGDLAPRDVVAAAIDARLRATGDPCVFLDARGIADFERRFPTVTAACRAAGVDPVTSAHPGGSGRALQLRRRGDRCARSDRAARAVRRGRGRPHRDARRQPVGVQQLAGGSGGRGPGGQGRGRARGAARTRSARRQGSRPAVRRWCAATCSGR